MSPSRSSSDGVPPAKPCGGNVASERARREEPGEPQHDQPGGQEGQQPSAAGADSQPRHLAAGGRVLQLRAEPLEVAAPTGRPGQAGIRDADAAPLTRQPPGELRQLPYGPQEARQQQQPHHGAGQQEQRGEHQQPEGRLPGDGLGLAAGDDSERLRRPVRAPHDGRSGDQQRQGEQQRCGQRHQQAGPAQRQRPEAQSLPRGPQAPADRPGMPAGQARAARGRCCAAHQVPLGWPGRTRCGSHWAGPHCASLPGRRPPGSVPGPRNGGVPMSTREVMARRGHGP